MRRFISLLLTVSFIIVSASGLWMYVGHQNRSRSSAPPYSSQTRPFFPKTAHEWFGLVFIGAGIVHLGLNIRPLKSYLKLKK